MRHLPRFKILTQRDLRFVFGAALVSNLGDGVITVALAFAILDRGHSATDLGLVIAIGTVMLIAGLLVGGVVADRGSRRKVMIVADLVRFFSQGTMGVLLLTGHASVWEFAVAQGFVGAAKGFFNPASLGLLPAVAGDHLHEANALRGLIFAAASIIGPALGGVLVVAVGTSWAFPIDAVSYIASALLLLRVSPAAAAAQNRDRKPSSRFLSEMRGGFEEFTSRTWVWSLVASFAVSNALVNTFRVFGPVICQRYYGGASAYAALNTVFAIGSVLGGLVVLRYKPRRPLLAGVIACIPLALPGFMLALRLPIAAIIPVQLLSGIGPVIFNPLWSTALQQRVPPEAISRVVSYDFAGSYALQPIALALAGPLVILVGVSAAISGCAAVAELALLANLLVRDVRTLRAGVPLDSADVPPDPAVEVSA